MIDIDYTEKAKMIKKLNLDADTVDTIQICINNFWQGNYFRLSEHTQSDVKMLSEKIYDKENLTITDIETMLWLLDRYGFTDELNSIVNISVGEIPTNYT